MSKPALMPLVVVVVVLLVQDAASTTTTFSWNDQPQLVSFTFEGEYVPDAMAMFRNVHNGRLACTTAVPVTWFASQCSSSSTSQLASFLAGGHEIGLHALSESTIPSDLACLSKLTYVRGFRGPQQVRLAAFRSGVLYDSSEAASSSSSWPYALTSPGGLFEVDVVQGTSAADTLGRFVDNYNGERRPFVLSLTQLSAVIGQQATTQVVSTIMQYADVVAVTASQISRMVFVDSSARADALMNICRQPTSSSTTRAPRSLYGQTSSSASGAGASEATGSTGIPSKPATTSAPTGQPIRTGSDGTAAPSTRSPSAADSTGGTATAPAGTTSAGHTTAPASAGSETNGASTTATSSTPSATGTVAPATAATTGNGNGGTRSTTGGIDSGTTAASTIGAPTLAPATSADAIPGAPTSTPATSTDAASGATLAPTTTTVPTAVPTSAPTTSADGSAGGNANGGTTGATGASGTTKDNGATSGSAGATGASSGTLASAASAGGAKGDTTSASATAGSGTTVPTTLAPTPAPTPAGSKSAPTPAPTAGYQSSMTPAPTSASGKSSSSGPTYVPYVLGAGGCLCALLVFVAYKVRRREDRFPAIVTGGYAFEAEDRDIFDLEADSRLTPFDATTLEAASAVPPMDISTQVADEESLRSFTGFTTSSFASLTRTTNNVL